MAASFRQFCLTLFSSPTTSTKLWFWKETFLRKWKFSPKVRILTQGTVAQCLYMETILRVSYSTGNTEGNKPQSTVSIEKQTNMSGCNVSFSSSSYPFSIPSGYPNIAFSFKICTQIDQLTERFSRWWSKTQNGKKKTKQPKTKLKLTLSHTKCLGETAATAQASHISPSTEVSFPERVDCCNPAGSISAKGLWKRQVCTLHFLLFDAWNPHKGELPSSTSHSPSSSSSCKDGRRRNSIITVPVQRVTIRSSKNSWTCRCRNANERWIIHAKILKYIQHSLNEVCSP